MGRRGERDLDHLVSEFRAELHKELGGVYKEFGGLRSQLQTMTLSLAGLIVTTGGVGVAAARLL